MAAKDVAKAWQSLTQADQAVSLLHQAYTLANNSGIGEDVRNQFKVLFDAVSEHRSKLQENASATLKENQ